MIYQRRIVDDELDALLPSLAGISLEGAKGVGKTATAERRAQTVIALDDPRQRAVVAADPLISRAQPPVLIDEWQHEPVLWDRVRRLVDADSTGGRFVLTGPTGPTSATRIHSGAGRIVRLLMRPLALCEGGLIAPTVSLATLLTRREPAPAGGLAGGPRGVHGRDPRIRVPGHPTAAPAASSHAVGQLPRTGSGP